MSEIEDKMQGLTLGDKNRKSARRKLTFTRHSGALQRQLDHWKKDIKNTQCDADTRESLLQVRGDYEAAIGVYEAIQAEHISPIRLNLKWLR